MAICDGLESMTLSQGQAALAAKIPKVELHLHMEGAIPVETLLTFIKRAGGSLVATPKDLRNKLTYRDFPHFIEVWSWLTSFLTEERDFEEVAYRVLGELSKNNVKYVEAFYSPGDFRRQGLTPQGITERMIRGKEKGYADFGIRSELIVDMVRNFGPDYGSRLIDDLSPYLGKGLIGVGLGGSEDLFPAGPYVEVYHKARKLGYRLTAHAGELAGADSIRAAVEKLGVERIGHGLRAYEDPNLIRMLKQQQTPLEMCVTINVATKVCETVEAHPIARYFRQGLCVTANSDDPTYFNTSMNQEYALLAQDLGLTLQELERLSLNGIVASFMSDGEKERARAQFKKEWNRIHAR